MIVKCKICGKEFEAKQRNHNICSSECRQINRHKNNQNFAERNPEKRKEYSRRQNDKRRKANPTFCKICGKVVEPHISPMGYHSRYHYHRDCLVNEAIAAILRGEKFNNSEKNILAVAKNKGYTKAELLEIMKERGLEQCRN